LTYPWAPRRFAAIPALSSSRCTLPPLRLLQAQRGSSIQNQLSIRHYGNAIADGKGAVPRLVRVAYPRCACPVRGTGLRALPEPRCRWFRRDVSRRSFGCAVRGAPLAMRSCCWYPRSYPERLGALCFAAGRYASFLGSVIRPFRSALGRPPSAQRRSRARVPRLLLGHLLRSRHHAKLFPVVLGPASLPTRGSAPCRREGTDSSRAPRGAVGRLGLPCPSWCFARGVWDSLPCT